MTGVGVGRGLIVVCDFEAVDRARVAQVLAWAEFAREASLSPTTVARLRRTPRVRLGTLDRVADVLGMPVRSLVFGQAGAVGVSGALGPGLAG